MDFLLKQRLVGAIVLVALGVIFIPMLLEGPDRTLVPEMEELPALIDTEPAKPLGSFPSADAVPEEPDQAVIAADVLPEPEPEPEASEAAAVEQALEELPEPPAAKVADSVKKPEPLGSWVVQVGSFSSQENAIGLRDKLRGAGFVTQVEKERIGGKTYFRVRVGPFLERAEAEQTQKVLVEKHGKKTARVLSYP